MFLVEMTDLLTGKKVAHMEVLQAGIVLVSPPDRVSVVGVMSPQMAALGAWLLTDRFVRVPLQQQGQKSSPIAIPRFIPPSDLDGRNTC